MVVTFTVHKQETSNMATKGLYNTLSCLILFFIFENVRFPKAFTPGQTSHSVIIREVSDV